MITKGLQTVYENIGNYGCGFLAMLEQFGYDDKDITRLYFECIDNGIIDKDCYVKSWQKLADYLSKEKYNAVISKNLLPCDFYLEYWYNPRTGYHHFKLPQWDSLENSVTVREGYLESYRLFTKIK